MGDGEEVGGNWMLLGGW